MIKLTKREILKHLKIDYPEGTKVFDSVCEAIVYLQKILKNHPHEYVDTSHDIHLCDYIILMKLDNSTKSKYTFAVFNFDDAVVIKIETQKTEPFGMADTINDYSEWLSIDQFNDINESNTLEAIL